MERLGNPMVTVSGPLWATAGAVKQKLAQPALRKQSKMSLCITTEFAG
jgi:hypothetical protein